MKVLVCGGAGYIGSHTCVELLNAGFEVAILDNLINSKEEALRRVEKITGKAVPFFHVDLQEEAKLRHLFTNERFDAVIHFAALKAVGESVERPLDYYQNNINGTLCLLKVMEETGVRNIVFSSSATVYGDNNKVPFTEDMPTSATNPYGWTKVMIERIIKDLAATNSGWNAIMLRYFNPVGAHESGLIGEDPQGIPNNLVPFVSQVAVGLRPELRVFGADYPTTDGTCLRDYIHVVDLALGHLKALKKLGSKCGYQVYNLGTGKPSSVFEVIKAYEKACGKPIPYKVVERRAGDIPSSYADPALAAKELGWKAERSLDDMLASSWKWQSQNPRGYGD